VGRVLHALAPYALSSEIWFIAADAKSLQSGGACSPYNSVNMRSARGAALARFELESNIASEVSVPFTPLFADFLTHPVWAVSLSDHSEIAWGVLVGLIILIVAEIGAGVWLMRSGDPRRIHH